MSDAASQQDIAALAKGGRTNFFGFLLRLAARLPFLFIAGRLYGAETLGRFASAMVIIELGATPEPVGHVRPSTTRSYRGVAPVATVTVWLAMPAHGEQI